MHGKPSAKLVPAHHLDDLLSDGAGFAGFAAGDIGQGPDDPDMIAIPDPRTLTILPWQPNVARFACDVTVEGEPWPYCPRTILRSAARACRRAGYELKIGAELEYFLLRRAADGAARARRPARHARAALLRHARADPQPRLRLRRCPRPSPSSAGTTTPPTTRTPTASSSRTSQYADALTTCDRAVFFRYMVETLAQQRGLIATFMPKPFAHLTGNGCHFHVSLWKDGENVFERDPDRGPARPRAVRARLQLPRRPQGPRQGLHRASPHRPSTPTSGSMVGRADQRRHLGAGLRQLRLQQPHPDAAHPRAGPDRGPDRRRLVQPLPGRHGDARRRAWTGSSASSMRASRTRPTCTR